MYILSLDYYDHSIREIARMEVSIAQCVHRCILININISANPVLGL